MPLTAGACISGTSCQDYRGTRGGPRDPRVQLYADSFAHSFLIWVTKFRINLKGATRQRSPRQPKEP